jgi:hypothetical protein
MSCMWLHLGSLYGTHSRRTGIPRSLFGSNDERVIDEPRNGFRTINGSDVAVG